MFLYCIYPCTVPSLNKDVTYLLYTYTVRYTILKLRTIFEIAKVSARSFEIGPIATVLYNTASTTTSTSSGQYIWHAVVELLTGQIWL